MATCLVAERLNAERWPRLEGYRAYDPERYWELMFRMGVFGRGRGITRLRSLGISWDYAVNLLPPSPAAGEWDASEASLQAMFAWMWSPRLRRAQRLVLCGTRVAHAVLGRGAGVLSSGHLPSGQAWFVAPHPSGRSRFWNEENRIIEAELAYEGWIAQDIVTGRATNS